MNDRVPNDERLDELEASIKEIIDRQDQLEDLINSLEVITNDLEEEIISLDLKIGTYDSSSDVATLEDEIKGIKTEIYYMRDELK